MTRGHLDYLVRDPRVQLTAWHDPSKQSAEGRNVLEKAGAVWLPEEDLVTSPDVDMVFVGSPDKFHLPTLRACIAAGKHVMCEKPVGVHREDMPHLVEIITLAAQEKLLLSTCHPRRFDPPILALKQMIDDPQRGTLPLFQIVGKIERFEFGFWYHKPSKTNLHASLMSDHFSHEIDLLRFLFGGGVKDFRGEVVRDGELSYIARGTTAGDAPIDFQFCGYRHLEEEEYVEVIRLVGTRGSMTLNLNTGTLTEDRTGNTLSLAPKSYATMFRDLNANVVGAAMGQVGTYIDPWTILFNNGSAATLLDHGSFPWIDSWTALFNGAGAATLLDSESFP
jgi:predicted dehydrogenase